MVTSYMTTAGTCGRGGPSRFFAHYIYPVVGEEIRDGPPLLFDDQEEDYDRPLLGNRATPVIDQNQCRRKSHGFDTLTLIKSLWAAVASRVAHYPRRCAPRTCTYMHPHPRCTPPSLVCMIVVNPGSAVAYPCSAVDVDSPTMAYYHFLGPSRSSLEVV
jgi:hypothetical protein